MTQKQIERLIKKRFRLSQDCLVKKAMVKEVMCPKDFAIVHINRFSKKIAKEIYKNK